MDSLPGQIARIKRTFVHEEWKKTVDRIISKSGRILPNRMTRISVVEWTAGGWNTDDFDLDRIDYYWHDKFLYGIAMSFVFPIGPFGILIPAEVLNVTLGYAGVVLLAWDTYTDNIYRVDGISGGGPLTDYIDLNLWDDDSPNIPTV